MLLRTVSLAALIAFAIPLPVRAAPAQPIQVNTPVQSAGPLLPLNGTVAITVPLHLKGIPKFYTGAVVYCSFRYVGQTPSATMYMGAGTESAASKLVTLVNGAYDGNVTVTIKQQTTAPAQINGYWCQFTSADQGGTGPAIVPLNGAAYTPIVQGSF